MLLHNMKNYSNTNLKYKAETDHLTLLWKEKRKCSDPSAKLYSETWLLNRQGTDNGKQI